MNKKGILVKLREEKGASQELLASLLGVSRPTYVSIELGKKELTISQAQKLCDFYQISLEKFLKGQIEPLSEVDLEAPTGSSKNLSQETLRISVPQEKIAIFKEVLLYILNQVGGKSNVGQTVIYKLLYFIDFDFYEKYETQLIGAKYIRNHHGPTPIEFKKIVEQMVVDEELVEVKNEYFNYPQNKYLPRRKADLSVISGREKEHIDSELARLSDMTASQLSALSHKDVPWISASHGEVLDYEAVFYRTPETSVRTYDGGDNI